MSIVIPVFRDAERATSLIHALRQQRLPSTNTCEIIVVDDGSGDDTREHLIRGLARHARLLLLERNCGRAAARNHGASKATGDVLLFIDCDCLPLNENFVMQHLEAMGGLCTASIGPVVGSGDGFWHRYQSEASERRAKQHAKGITYSGSSQNLMVRRQDFESIGGFDTAYRAYGFEDRDLQIRLAARGAIKWTAGAVIRHMDTLTLQSVSRKMHDAGAHSSLPFARTHPAEYKRLGYSALDPRRKFWLRTLGGPAQNAWLPLAKLGDRYLDSRLLWYPVKRMFVRLVTALSYLAGASRATEPPGRKT